MNFSFSGLLYLSWDQNSDGNNHQALLAQHKRWLCSDTKALGRKLLCVHVYNAFWHCLWSHRLWSSLASAVCRNKFLRQWWYFACIEDKSMIKYIPKLLMIDFFFPEKQLMILDVPSETSDFQRRMSGISEESKPHTQHLSWAGYLKQMDSWKEVPVFWTLPNNSEYFVEEVRCPPENCKLFKNAKHQKGTLRKAYLGSNGK